MSELEKALSFTVFSSGGESYGFNPARLIEVIKLHQQELADEMGRKITWDDAVRGYFNEQESSFLTLLSDARNECFKAKLPEAGPGLESS